MDRFDRIFQLHRIFPARRTPIGEDERCARPGCSPAAMCRLAGALRDRAGCAAWRERPGVVPSVQSMLAREPAPE